MSNIGYAVFKKITDLIVDSNGLFEQLHVDNYLIFDNPALKLQKGDKLLSYRRIVSRKDKLHKKDGYLVVLLEKIETENNNQAIIGSAICFKEQSVFENKIIDGVQYLLSQLKKNFETVYDIEDDDLGVVLPSITKDFKIFKETRLNYIAVKQYVNGFSHISYIREESKKYLHHFCHHSLYRDVEHLLLIDKEYLIDNLLVNNFKQINLPHLEQTKEDLILKKSNSTTSTVELKKTKEEKNIAVKHKNMFAVLTLVFLGTSILFGILYITKSPQIIESVSAVKNNAIAPIEGNFYVNAPNYKAFVRKGAGTQFAEQAVLSDGDKVFVKGIDKSTLWMKILFNNNSEEGYISYKLISPTPNDRRLQIIDEDAYVKSVYNTSVYSAPYTLKQESNGESSDALCSLTYNYKIHVKYKVINRSGDWYSIKVEKNGQIYNGYLQGEDFGYQQK